MNQYRPYPADPWKLVEQGLHIGNARKNGTVFSIGNGYLGFRGHFEDRLVRNEYAAVEGCYINGFFESHTIKYPEAAYGYASTGETMLNLPNGTLLRIEIDGKEVVYDETSVSNCVRELSFRSGELRREYIWSNGSKKTKMVFRRFVSMTHKNIAAIRLECTALDETIAIKIDAGIDGNISNIAAGDDPRVGSGTPKDALKTTETGAVGNDAWLLAKTENSGLAMCCMEALSCSMLPAAAREYNTAAGAGVYYTFNVAAGQSVTVEKLLIYTDSRCFEAAELLPAAKAIASEYRYMSYEGLLGEQLEFYKHFWKNADIAIEGAPELQQAIRYNMFQLLQSAGDDGKTSIAAKGLSGEGYEGQYFWDSEIYAFTHFLYTNPQLGRSLLQYRYTILDKARERAKMLGFDKGALFPWRTIHGEECSAYYPAGTAQYHINADIAYAIKQYVDVTDDKDFLVQMGAEILFETARVWVQLGFFDVRKNGAFCINCVTGPDEYSALINNNCYTNLMAQANLEYAANVANWLREEHPDVHGTLVSKMGLHAKEVESWLQAAEKMFVPYDPETGVYLQDDAFLEREPWREACEKTKRPLLLHYHPLVIYRYRVCKQADLVLAMLLRGECFSPEEKRKNFRFYEQYTVHDSSLSSSVFSVLAAETGQMQKAYDYFIHTVRMDLDDYKGNTCDGLHIASMAGSWMGIAQGFGGLRQYNGLLYLNPVLPDLWNGYRFKVVFRGALLQVSVDRDKIEFALQEGARLCFYYQDRAICLDDANSIKIIYKKEGETYAMQ
jgi:alpha,alpha-trehalose phosphorylase